MDPLPLPSMRKNARDPSLRDFTERALQTLSLTVIPLAIDLIPLTIDLVHTTPGVPGVIGPTEFASIPP